MRVAQGKDNLSLLLKKTNVNLKKKNTGFDSGTIDFTVLFKSLCTTSKLLPSLCVKLKLSYGLLAVRKYCVNCLKQST